MSRITCLGLTILAFVPHGLLGVVVNFDMYPDDSPVQPSDVFTTQWTSVGVEFAGGPQPSGNPCSISPPNHAYAPSITAIFVDPCTGIPSVTDFAGAYQDHCWAPGEGIDMYAYDAGGNEIGHQFSSGGASFAAFTFPQPIIARMVMIPQLQGIDDLTFNQPVAVPRGDLDCSGTVDLQDVDPFVLALLDTATYSSIYPTCGARRADCNCDRRIDGLDIGCFVIRLLGG